MQVEKMSQSHEAMAQCRDECCPQGTTGLAITFQESFDAIPKFLHDRVEIVEPDECADLRLVNPNPTNVPRRLVHLTGRLQSHQSVSYSQLLFLRQNPDLIPRDWRRENLVIISLQGITDDDGNVHVPYLRCGEGYEYTSWMLLLSAWQTHFRFAESM